MICMAMFGNGYRMNGMVAMKALLLMAVLGRREVALTGSIAAAAGAASPDTAGQPFAAAITHDSATAASAFAF